ncbi:unnamed protein product [Polarella glacialis]|uniref:JmjC domain-containing protein n=1 Tax=Polarella glacialis TaxID=89957 RepID=A0A813H5A2_POLGL|nr:unnamed protein product [Polarella glacialis]
MGPLAIKAPASGGGDVLRCDGCGSWSASDFGAAGAKDSEFAEQWFCQDCWREWEKLQGPQLDEEEAQLDLLAAWGCRPRRLPPTRPSSRGKLIRHWDAGRNCTSQGIILDGPLLVSGSVGDGLQLASFSLLFMQGLSNLTNSCDTEFRVRGVREAGPAFVLLYLSDLGQDVLGLSEEVLLNANVLGHPAWVSQWSELGEDLSEAVMPEGLRPRCQRTLLVQGPGSETVVRRDAQTFVGWDLLIDGSRLWRVFPPDFPLSILSAELGDLGAGVAHTSGCKAAELAAQQGLNFYEVIQEAGDLVLVPPGWWYQTFAEQKSLSVLGCHLPAGALKTVATALLPAEEIVKLEGRGNLSEQLQCLKAALESAYADRPAGDKPRRSCVHPLKKKHQQQQQLQKQQQQAQQQQQQQQQQQSAHPRQLEEAASDTGAEHTLGFPERIRQLLFEEFRTLPSVGICVPEDAAFWSNDALRIFADSSGFLKPSRRFAVQPHCVQPLEDTWAASKSRCVEHSVSNLTAFINQGDPDYPRVIWSYWAQGASQLPQFRRLCTMTWSVQNPGWRYVLLDSSKVFRFVDRQDLPEHWEQMGHEHAADAVRLALLSRWGGVWTDVGSICLKPLDAWVWDEVSRGSRGLGAFYYAYYGLVSGESSEYVENWFLAARRCHPFVIEWHATFLKAWHGKRHAEEVHKDPMFHGLDLAFLDKDQQRYLTMHLVFAKLVQEQEDMRRIWQEEMLLLRADDHVLGWMAGLNDREDVIRVWIYEADPQWVDSLTRNAPMIKFIGKFARGLDVQPLQQLIRRKNNLQQLLIHALQPAGVFIVAD